MNTTPLAAAFAATLLPDPASATEPSESLMVARLARIPGILMFAELPAAGRTVHRIPRAAPLAIRRAYLDVAASRGAELLVEAVALMRAVAADVLRGDVQTLLAINLALEASELPPAPAALLRQASAMH